MTIVFLGFVLLLVALFPMGDLLAPLLLAPFRSSLKGTPPMVLHLLVMAISLVPAALVTGWFLRSSLLSERVPRPVAGSGFLLLGVVLMVFYLLAGLLASTVQGGGGTYVVMSLAPFVVWPARFMLVVGVCKALLSASPTNQTMAASELQHARQHELPRFWS
jgi:hypothetical protein